MLLAAVSVFGQNAGNVTRHVGNSIYQHQIQLNGGSFNIPANQGNDLVLTIKGLSNVKADAYVALFNVSQMGKTAQEVNELMDARIKRVQDALKAFPEITLHVDMVTFLPVYEFAVEKKVFSKNSYNEVPVGFKLKKNLHIKFANNALIHQLVTICANAEIYDLVRVDYISNDLEAQKEALVQKAQTLLHAKIERYEGLMNIKTDTLTRRLNEGFKVTYPVEMYKTCQAYSSSSISQQAAKSGNLHVADKATTQYYQPVVNKEFDFEINPTVIEPVIQVMYQVTLHIRLVQPAPRQVVVERTKHIILTPDGDVMPLDVN